MLLTGSFKLHNKWTRAGLHDGAEQNASPALSCFSAPYCPLPPSPPSLAQPNVQKRSALTDLLVREMLLLSRRENNPWWLLYPQISSCEMELAHVSGSQAAVLSPSHLQPALVLVWVWFLCVVWLWCMLLKFHMLKVVDNVYLQILKNR